MKSGFLAKYPALPLLQVKEASQDISLVCIPSSSMSAISSGHSGLSTRTRSLRAVSNSPFKRSTPTKSTHSETFQRPSKPYGDSSVRFLGASRLNQNYLRLNSDALAEYLFPSSTTAFCVGLPSELLPKMATLRHRVARFLRNTLSKGSPSLHSLASLRRDCSEMLWISQKYSCRLCQNLSWSIEQIL